MRDFSITMVFPAYNEALNLESLVESAFRNAQAVTDDFEVIVVNDGSKDNTQEVLDALEKKFKDRLKPIHLNPNRGYATALKTGFMNAGKDFIFYSDADNQFDLSELALLLPHCEDNDMVIGYRKDRKDNILRIFASKCYNCLVRFLFGLKVKDIDCAFKLFKREVFKKIDIQLEKFLLDTEVLVKARRLNMKIAEIGVTHLPREKGATTVRFRDVIFTLRGLMKLRRNLKHERG